MDLRRRIAPRADGRAVEGEGRRSASLAPSTRPSTRCARSGSSRSRASRSRKTSSPSWSVPDGAWPAAGPFPIIMFIRRRSWRRFSVRLASAAPCRWSRRPKTRSAFRRPFPSSRSRCTFPLSRRSARGCKSGWQRRGPRETSARVSRRQVGGAGCAPAAAADGADAWRRARPDVLSGGPRASPNRDRQPRSRVSRAHGGRPRGDCQGRCSSTSAGCCWSC